MDEDFFTLAVVGHNLAAQCDVANCILGHTSEPEIVQFKKQLTAKHIRWRFVAGDVHILVTPSLDTPRWKKERKQLKQQKNKIFVYVRAIGGFSINDEEAIKNIKTFFGKKTNIILVIYHEEVNNKTAEDQCKTVIPRFQGNYICLKSSMIKKKKIEFVKPILCMASNMVIVNEESMRPHFRGSDLYELCSTPTDVANKVEMSRSVPIQKKFVDSMKKLFSTSSNSTPQENEKYRRLDARMETFKKWPIDIGLPPVLLSTAGLFFTEDSDMCVCFECCVSLKNWRVDHDPWIQHIRGNPDCAFLAKTWGSEYMKEAKKELLIHQAEKKMMVEKMVLDQGGDISNKKTERPGTPEITSVEITDTDWDYYMETLTRVPKIEVPSFHTRVNIIGFQGVGKTTLLGRLQGMDSDMDHPPESTEGLGIERSVSRTFERSGTRQWESNSKGYDFEMNHERMALSLKEVTELVQNHGLQNRFHRVEKTSMSGITETNVTLEQLSTSNQQSKEERRSQDVEHNCSGVTRTGTVSLCLKYGSDDTQTFTINDEKEKYLQSVLQKMQSSPGERIYLTYWDFAGQAAYYTTHQAFMSPWAVYLLVIDLSASLDVPMEDSLTFKSTKIEKSSPKDTIKFWGGSIKAYTVDENDSNAPVIVVGTHKDKVTPEITDEVFNTVRDIMKIDDLACIAIDNTLSAKDDKFLRELRDKLIDDGLGVIRRKIPAAWIRIEYNLLIKKQEGKKIIKLKELIDICEAVDVSMDEGDLQLFLEYEHCNGFLIHFPHVSNEVSNLIVLDPTVIVTFINKLMRNYNGQSLISKNTGWCRNGNFNRRYVDDAMSKALEGLCNPLLTLLEHLKIIHMNMTDKGNSFFMPSLLRHNPKKSKSLTPHKQCKDKTPSMKLTFKNQALPPSFFNSLTASLMSEWELYKIDDEEQIFDMYSCFDFGGITSFLELCWSESCILMQAFNFSSQEKLENLHIDALVDTVRKHVYTILQTYRHMTTNCTVLICCPQHDGVNTLVKSYLNLDDLLKKEEALCHYEDECHGVSRKEALGSWYSDNIDSHQQIDASLQNAVDEKILTRLATALNLDGAHSLSSKLQLNNTWTVAYKAKEESKGSKVIARFLVLIEWKRQDKGASTVGELKDLLTRLQVYTWDTLKKHIDGNVQQKSYEVDANLLRQKPSDRDCIHISRELTDPRYIFLFIELGLTHVDIQRAHLNTMGKTEDTINKLLIQWREQHNEKATLQILLDTLSMLQIHTHQIVQKLKPQ